ncbi:hypothetical protein PKOR_13765 [Pontibacter korlensis]|uniref:Uncharacterized protein n=1 Tax=Pontibacter korlensis TaxID=400092 RepID=A0A0E3UXX1_9BACT|nr:hypothetical protein [Pontibacter korlensis]AKD03971.1 hypothetical protein PKOR_13765 [Pontibacter korlensis]
MSATLPQLNNKESKIIKWFLLTVLVAFWLLVGLKEHAIKQAIASSIYFVIKLFDLPAVLYSSTEHAYANLTKVGSRLITLSYGIAYCGTSLLVIHMYFMNISITKLTLGLYISMFIASLLINEVGKELHFETFRVVAYRIMSMTLSPVPIMLIIPALQLHAKKEV